MRFPALAIVALVVVPVSLTGCGKKEQPQQAPAAPATTTITVNGGTVAVREEEGVQRYSDEGPESGTVYLVHDAILRKGADQSSDIISRLGRGTGVNKKARRGAYYLVDFPSAGAMKPGWLPQSDVNSQPTVVTTTTPTTTTIPVRKARPLGSVQLSAVSFQLPAAPTKLQARGFQPSESDTPIMRHRSSSDTDRRSVHGPGSAG